MHIEPGQPTSVGPDEWFTGRVYLDVIAAPKLGLSGVHVYSVHFAPRARTAWHQHAVGQTLYVTEGVGRTQARGREVIEIRPGQSIYIPSGEWHWHGAAPEHFMTHLAIWEGTGDGQPETHWAEHVTDAEYGNG